MERKFAIGDTVKTRVLGGLVRTGTVVHIAGYLNNREITHTYDIVWDDDLDHVDRLWSVNDVTLNKPGTVSK